MRRKLLVVLLAVGCLLLGRSAFAVSQLIQDGGFESLNPETYWQTGGNSQTGVSFFPNVAHTGFESLQMGNANGPIIQEVFQTVTVPTNTILLQVSYFWAMVDTNDASDTAEFFAFLADADDNPLTGGTLDSEFNQAGSETGWRQVTGVSTNLAGQTIDMAFEVQLSTGAGITTSFYVDDVSMLAFTPADIPPNDFFTNSTTLNTASNIIALGTNVLATKETGEPPKIAGNPGGHSLWWNWTAPSNGEVIINTAGSTFSTLLGVFTGDSLSTLKAIAENANGANSQVKILVTAGTTYQIAVDGKNGATGVVELNLAFALDTKDPTVAITSPGNNAKLTNSTVVVKGTASDNLGVASVQYRLVNADGTNDYQTAVGTNSWTATITDLIPGPNTIQVFSVDTSSNQSPVVSRTVNFILVSPFSLTVNGVGAVSPNLDNDLLDVGDEYTMTAKPGAGQVFSNWVGPDGVLATTARLTFTMQTNLALQANFVTNPFTPIVGGYQGLFYDSINGPQHESSGFVNLVLGSSGSYSARVIVAGLSYKLSGQFSAGGMASNNIVRKGLSPVSVQLQLDLTGGGITGVLSESNWIAQLNADPIATAATAARYTLLIPGGPDGIELPGGDSYGTVTVSSRGAIGFAGALADGTKVSQKANLLENGQWPFYIGLYSGKGSIFGWLTFSNQPDSDITGTNVYWFKPEGASGKFYPGGFTNVSDATGSLFTNAAPVMNLTTGQVVFSNGNLATFTNLVTLSAANKITNDTTNNALTMSITTSSGLFKCTAVNPATGKAVTADGVILQKQNLGGGFFLGTNETGRIVFSPASP